MKQKILLDENNQYKFDFSNCEYVWQINNLANKLKLKDVDFITEIDDEILFIEYKNSNIPNARRPEAMYQKIKSEPQKFYESISKKYYDSLLILWSCRGNEQDKSISYIFLVEDKLIDKSMRKRLHKKIIKQLPLNLEDDDIKREIISKFEVCNLKEWELYHPNIKITPITNLN